MLGGDLVGGRFELEGAGVHAEEIEERKRGEIEGDGFDGEGVVNEVGGRVEDLERRGEFREEGTAGDVVEEGGGTAYTRSKKNEKEGEEESV